MNFESVRILDGGISTELANHGFQCDNDPLWSARWIASNPQALRVAHTSFLENGADVIETASYQASIQGFCDYLEVTISKAQELIKDTAVLAQECRDTFWEVYRKKIDDGEVTSDDDVREKPLVAGSIGPYGAFLHDGSEYTGSYISSMSIEEIMDWHRPRMSCLVEADVDLLAIETIPAAKEARALIRLLREFPNTKAWLSFSCSEPEKLCSGDGLAPSASLCIKEATPGQLIAVGINCVPPDTVHNSISLLTKMAPPLKVLVYPNSGDKWNPETGWTATEPSQAPFHSYVPSWLNCGADWIGGCCQVASDEICKIREMVINVQSKSKARLSS